MKSKVPLIAGITGQDGSYLAEVLLGKEGVHDSRNHPEDQLLQYRKD